MLIMLHFTTQRWVLFYSYELYREYNVILRPKDGCCSIAMRYIENIMLFYSYELYREYNVILRPKDGCCSIAMSSIENIMSF